MDQCIKLACKNAKRLADDAELLFKAGRPESAFVFITFAKEEEGKAVMAAQWWLQRKNLTRKEYFDTFRARESHEQKLVEATRIQFTQSMPDGLRKATAHDDITRREDALYTDYDFSLRQWALPRLEFVSQLSPAFAAEGKDALTKFDQLVIKQDIVGIRKDIASFLSFFEKNKNEHIPGAAIAIPDREPKLRAVPRRYKLSQLREMETAMVDKRDEYRNMVAGSRFAKWPTLSIPWIDDLRKKRDEAKPDEDRRVLTKLVVDDLRRSLNVEFDKVLDLVDDKGDYVKELTLMNEYAVKFAIPFCRQRRYPWPVKRMMNIINERRDKMPFDLGQWWHDSYHGCSNAFRTMGMSEEARYRFFKVKAHFHDLVVFSDWTLVF